MKNNYTLIFTDSTGFEYEIVEFKIAMPSEAFKHIDEFIKSLRKNVQNNLTLVHGYIRNDEDFNDDSVMSIEDIEDIGYVKNKFYELMECQ
jgi:hypothetical protein